MNCCCSRLAHVRMTPGGPNEMGTVFQTKSRQTRDFSSNSSIFFDSKLQPAFGIGGREGWGRREKKVWREKAFSRKKVGDVHRAAV